MGTIIDTLTLSQNSRHTVSTDPVINLRRKMAANLDHQICAAKAEMKGETYCIEVEKWVVTDQLTGTKARHKAQKIVRKMWYRYLGERIFLELRFGHKLIQIGDKSSIQVGDISNLVPVLEKVKQAILDGELDTALKMASDSRKSAKKAGAVGLPIPPTITKPELVITSGSTPTTKSAPRPAL